MSRCVVIGLDGGTFDLILPWIKKGWLPNLGKLIENGTWGVLESFPPVTGPAWVSFATGKNPGKHGIYSFFKPTNSIDNFRIVSSKDIKGKTFYEILGRFNKKVILVNLPCTYPPRISGIVITSILTQGNNFIFPPELKHEITLLNYYRLFPTNLDESTRTDEDIKEIREIESIRFKCVRELFKRYEWDLFFWLISGSDWIQHSMYHEMYLGRVNESSECVKAFKEFDEYIGWFAKNLPKDCNLIILSDHGFRVYRGIFSVNEYLRSKGYLSYSKKELEPHRGLVEKQMAGRKVVVTINLRGLIRHIMKSRTMLNLARLVYRKFIKYLPIHVDTRITIDVSKTKAYFLQSSHGIYINDARFGGSVTSEEYNKYREELILLLRNLKDKEGKEVLDYVEKVENVYYGDLDDAPDIIINSSRYKLWQGPGPIFVKGSFNYHDLRGIFIAYGPEIAKRKLDRVIKIYDVAPTILYMLGCPIPSDMDGKVIFEIFTDDALERLRSISPKIKSKSLEEEKIKKIVRDINLRF